MIVVEILKFPLLNFHVQKNGILIIILQLYTYAYPGWLSKQQKKI